MTDTHKIAHVAVVPYEAWGHVRPLLHLTIQLLTLHPNLRITYLLSPEVARRVTTELASPNLAHTRSNTTILSRMQLVEAEVAAHTQADASKASAKGLELDGAQTGELVRDIEAKATAFAHALAGYFAVLFAGPAGGSTKIDNHFEGTPPTCVIYDMFQPFVPAVLHGVRTAIQLPPVHAFAFMPCGPTPAINLGEHITALIPVVEEGVARGENPFDIVAPLGVGDRGDIKTLPGLPAMTDFELHPGLGLCPPPPQILLMMFETFKSAYGPLQTGFIAVNVEEMESEAKAYSEADTGKPYISVGFQYSDNIWNGDIAPPAPEDKDGLEVMAFLDKMLELRGAKSVIYVSFGSAYFPYARPDIVHHILDTLLSTSTPFIFAYATEIFPVADELVAKIQDAEFGLAVHVAPQVQVLHHPATGYFLSHCGGSSYAEAIVAGVPIVAMPFGSDQGEHSEILKKYGAGIDLKQVKCFFGKGEKPKMLYDGTVLVGTEEAIKAEMVDLWAQLKGELGEKLYKGMAELNKLCKNSCSEGGRSRQAMLDFAKYF